MRKDLLDQLPLVPVPIDHVHARELSAIGVLLDQLPEASKLIAEDLVWRCGRRVDRNKGRSGISAEQVLRIGVLKQMSGFSYEELAFHLMDSNSYRAFCRIGFESKPMKKSRLQKNIKRVKPTTWEVINRMVILKANSLGIENGAKVRTDCTVVESNIHHPNDSSLLWDCVRVVVRLMRKAKKEFGLNFNDHSRRAKRRKMAISNAKSMKARKPLYRELLKLTDRTRKQAEHMLQQLPQVTVNSIMVRVKLDALVAELKKYVTLTSQVISQTERRVLRGESVAASEKIVSIFEPHTDIISKDNRETQYGHKLCLTSGASGLITDAVILKGNPSDATLATKMIERQRQLYNRAPQQAVFDGAFASRNNLSEIKTLGVRDVAFSKRCGLQIEDMVASKSVYRMLRAFRAGVEATVSLLKRAFGLARCVWRGFPSFQAYVQAAVLACNLRLVARCVLNSAR